MPGCHLPRHPGLVTGQAVPSSLRWILFIAPSQRSGSPARPAYIPATSGCGKIRNRPSAIPAMHRVRHRLRLDRRGVQHQLAGGPGPVQHRGPHPQRADRLHGDAAVRVGRRPATRRTPAPRAWSTEYGAEPSIVSSPAADTVQIRWPLPRSSQPGSSSRAARTCAITLTCQEMSQSARRPPRRLAGRSPRSRSTGRSRRARPWRRRSARRPRPRWRRRRARRWHRTRRRPPTAGAASMSLTTTRAPSAANRRARAAPMPLPAPVTTTPAPLTDSMSVAGGVGRPGGRSTRVASDGAVHGRRRAEGRSTRSWPA